MWSIGKIAQSTGCNIETIRYYERLSLLPEPPRTEGGHRLYNEVHRRRLVFIQRGRELGFGLKQIRGLIDLAESEEHSCGEALGVAEQHFEIIDDKLVHLQNIRTALAQMADRCRSDCACTKAPRCSILEALAGQDSVKSG